MAAVAKPCMHVAGVTEELHTEDAVGEAHGRGTHDGDGVSVPPVPLPEVRVVQQVLTREEVDRPAAVAEGECDVGE